MSDHRFALFWTSASVSYLGDGVRFVALPLLAASLSTSPGEVAAIAVAGGLPWALFGLIAGVAVDRLDRIRVMVAMQLARAAVGVALVVGTATGAMTIPLLAALVFLLYSFDVLNDIAFNAVLPAVVDAARLQWANGRLITAEVITFEFAGPALGGLLFVVSPALPFAVDGTTFVVSAVLLLFLARGTAARSHGAERHRSIRTDLTDGLRWFWGSPMIRSLTGVAVAVNVGMGGLYAVLVLFVGTELGLGPAGYGILLAIGATGAVLGGAVAGRLTAGRQRRAVVLLAAPATATGFAVIAVTNSVVLVAAGLAVLGLAVTVANVVMVSVRQLITPDAVLGRVMAVHRSFCWGALPVGAAAAGLIGEGWGVRASVAGCGVLVTLVGAVAILPLRRVRSQEYEGAVARS